MSMTKKFYHQSIIAMAISYLLFITILISVVTNNSVKVWLDAAIGNPIHQISNPGIQSILKSITVTGDPIIMTILTAIVAIILMFFKKNRWAYFFILNVAILSGGLNALIKNIIQRQRPTLEHLVSASGFSFPSGHSNGAMMFYGTMILFIIYQMQNGWLRRILITLCVIMILLIGISRIYVQVHFPTDVLGGYTLAFGTLMLSWMLFVRYNIFPAPGDLVTERRWYF